MAHQTPHYRTSRRGRRFVAGLGEKTSKNEIKYRIELDGKYWADIDQNGTFPLPFSSYDEMRRGINSQYKLIRVGNQNLPDPKSIVRIEGSPYLNLIKRRVIEDYDRLKGKRMSVEMFGRKGVISPGTRPLEWWIKADGDDIRSLFVASKPRTQFMY
ncbi:MAG TPA: hypothetical protein VJP79_02170 [Nitrososphaera sp.]|nr:hypothetical protein [Nitrososphaera sp.]